MSPILYIDSRLVCAVRIEQNLAALLIVARYLYVLKRLH